MDLEAFVNQHVNSITVLQAAGLFVLARAGLVVLRWVGRLLKFGFYLVASAMLRVPWVVWCCAYVLARWQVDVGWAILSLHSDHLGVQTSVSGLQGTKDSSAHLTVKSSARQFQPGWSTNQRADRRDQDTDWAAWAERRDRLDHYDQLLARQLRQVYRVPSDT